MFSCDLGEDIKCFKGESTWREHYIDGSVYIEHLEA